MTSAGSTDPNGSAARQQQPAAPTNGNTSPGSHGSGSPWVNVYMNERRYMVSEHDLREPNAEGTQNGWMGGGRGWVGVTESSRGQWEEVEVPARGWDNFSRTTAGDQPRVRLNIHLTMGLPHNRDNLRNPHQQRNQ